MTLIGYVLHKILYKGADHATVGHAVQTLGSIGGGYVSLGAYIIVEDNVCKYHEYGHSLQNCVYGWLFPLLVGIPSIVRFYWREWREAHGKALSDYDSAWFEAQATRWGNL
jgi:hypothetical protein